MNKIVYEKIVSILIVASLLFLNIFSYQEVYVGDFTKDRAIYYPPPFKTHSRVYVYSIVENHVDITEFVGLILGLTRSIGENEVVIIKSRGLDMYVLIISLIVVIIYFKLVKPYVSKTKLYIINTILLLTLITLMYTYSYLVSIPITYANLSEFTETINCSVPQTLLLNICFVDSFNTNSIIYLKSDSDVLVEILKDSSVIYRVFIRGSVDFVKSIETDTEYRVVVLSSFSSINITYRRVSFIDTRDYLSTIIVSYLPMMVALTIIVFNKLLYMRF